MRETDVLVVGAGVIGLSTAVRLLERGHDLTVRARERTPRTTSDVAAAVYYPYRAHPERRVIPWARATLETFVALAADPEAGVVLRDIVEPLPDATERPWWHGMCEYRRARRDELTPGSADGFVLRGPVVEMPRYMRWLESRVLGLGGRIEDGHVPSLASLEGMARIVVNCSGLGARELANDPEVVPVRGQIVRVADPGISSAVLDQSTPLALAYVIPRADGVVLGGTSDEGAWDLAPDPAVERAILAKAARIDPRLEGCEVLERKVGLRPARREVRLEAERLGRLRLVHNYGHGGSGVTLSWGCAEEAVELVERALREDDARLVAPGAGAFDGDAQRLAW